MEYTFDYLELNDRFIEQVGYIGIHFKNTESMLEFINPVFTQVYGLTYKINEDKRIDRKYMEIIDITNPNVRFERERNKINQIVKFYMNDIFQFDMEFMDNDECKIRMILPDMNDEYLNNNILMYMLSNMNGIEKFTIARRKDRCIEN